MAQEVLTNYSKKEDSSWEKILNYGKILSDKEGDDMLNNVIKLRKERGFRNVSIH